MERLPGGGTPWFERRRKKRPFGATRWQFVPVSREGWAVLLAYTVVVALDTLVLLPESTSARLTIYFTILTVATVLLIVIAFKMSAPGWRDE